MPQPKKLPYVHLSIGPADDLSETSKEKVRHTEAKKSASKKRRRTTDRSSGSYHKNGTSASIPVLNSDQSSREDAEAKLSQGYPSSFAQTFPYGPAQISMPGVYPAVYGAPMVIPTMPNVYQAPMYYPAGYAPGYQRSANNNGKNSDVESDGLFEEEAIEETEDENEPDEQVEEEKDVEESISESSSKKRSADDDGSSQNAVNVAQIQQLQAQAYQAGRAHAMQQQSLQNALQAQAQAQAQAAQAQAAQAQAQAQAAQAQAQAQAEAQAKAKAQAQAEAASLAATMSNQPRSVQQPQAIDQPIKQQPQAPALEPSKQVQAAKPLQQPTGEAITPLPVAQPSPVVRSIQPVQSVQPQAKPLTPINSAAPVNISQSPQPNIQTPQPIQQQPAEQKPNGVQNINAAKLSPMQPQPIERQQSVHAVPPQSTSVVPQQAMSQIPVSVSNMNKQPSPSSTQKDERKGIFSRRKNTADELAPGSDESMSDAQKKLQKNRERQKRWANKKNPKKAENRDQANMAAAEAARRNSAASQLNAMEEDRRRNAEAARRREMEDLRRRKAEESRRREQEAARRAPAKNRSFMPAPKMQPNKPDMRKAAGKKPGGHPEGDPLNRRATSMKEGMAGVGHAYQKNKLASIILIIAACIVVAILIFAVVFFAIKGDSDTGSSGVSGSASTSQSASSGSSGSSSTVSDGEVVYKYIAATNAGVPYTVIETVTFGDDGKCLTSTLDMTFPDAESAKAFTDSLARGQKDTFTLDELDGDHAVVTIDNHELGLDSSAYENALRYSVTDLEVSKG